MEPNDRARAAMRAVAAKLAEVTLPSIERSGFDRATAVSIVFAAVVNELTLDLGEHEAADRLHAAADMLARLEPGRELPATVLA